MPSSGSSDWADQVRDGLRRHEEGRTGSSGPAPGWGPGHDSLGEIALEWGLLDASCLRDCRQDLDDARRAGKVIPIEAILLGRGALRPEDLDKLRLERIRRSMGAWSIPRYDVRQPLGEGTSAIVFRAWDRELKREVALKVLREGAGLSAVARERFRREAEIAARMSHPNVLTLHDAGETKEGQLYHILELVDGNSLRDYLRGGLHDVREILVLIQKAACGVAAAHEKGIIHRDLKPANILVTLVGEPKVGDFGLAHLMDSTGDLTRTGTLLGTPLYMSPEQVSGRREELSPRTDVYALGAILYEATVGRPPHGGETISEIYRKVIEEEPMAPRRARPGIARDLETVILKALDKDPARRYATAQAFAEDLGRFLEGEPILARPIPAAGRFWRKAVKRRAILLPTAAAILLGVLAGVIASRTPRGPGKMVFFERLDGDVRVLQEGRRISARQGQILAPGSGVESGPPPSQAILRFEDGTQLEIGQDTSISDLAADPVKRLFLYKGSIRAEVPRQAQHGPLIIATSYGEAKGTGAQFRTLLDAGGVKSLRIDVEEGEVEHRRPDGMTIMIGNGYCAVWAADAEPVLNRFALLDLGGGVRMECVYLNPGSFTMGGTETAMEKPEHRVTISKGYYLGKNEVTRGQFAAFVKATGYRTDAEKEGRAYCWIEGGWREVPGANWRNAKFFAQTDDYPAMCISWNDAKAFCEWAAGKTERGVRLPTEAEWEYACRAGTQTRWSFGNADQALNDYAWTNKNSGMQTQPVGRKKPNAWGLSDMHGNVREWCQDFAGPYSGDGVDPAGPERGDRRCLRGGSWAEGAADCRSAFRNETPPSARNTNNGFRVALW